MRAVIGTNLFISSLFWQGNPARVYDAAVTREFTLLVTETLLAEIHRVLRYPKFESKLLALGQAADQLISIIGSLAEIVEPAAVAPNAIRNRNDIIVLACAVGGKADFIVSGDKDLLVLNANDNIPILTAEQFLQRLSSE